ncbi:unnamed protein product [Phaedon cochleariae]|uniref:C2H2-type domain-containing protein n=1 Tax=Phaedon cochleariae TaxID=80249 RepID=A0A9N9SN77_PHACE|nr:unnamed protein product [Phaedon cochleariae]
MISGCPSSNSPVNGVSSTLTETSYLMLSLGEVKVHSRKEHPHVKVNYACKLCRQQRGPKLHAIQVHAGKCRGEQALVQLDFPCEECGASFRSQRGLSIHEVTQHPERRNVARAEAAQQPERPLAPRAGTVFTENEVQVMLECEVTYYGHKSVAKMMKPHLPGKSNEQIRNKRRLTSYKTARDEILAAHLDAVGGAPEPAEQEQVGEIDGRQDELPQAAEVEERAASPPVIVVEEAQIENVAEELEHGETPEPQPEIELETISISDDEPAVEEIASPPATLDVEVQPAPTQVAPLVDDSIVIEDVVVPPAAGEEPQIDEVESAWRQRIVTSVLSREMPRHVRSLPVDTAMGILRDALLRAKDEAGNLSQAEIDIAYSAVKDIVQTENAEVPGQRRNQEGGRGRGQRRRYLYARTQDLYHENPALVAKHVRTNVDWLEQSGVTCPDADVRELYNRLWGHRPDVQLPDLAKRDGGLGIPRLQWLLTSAALKAGCKFMQNPDPAMQAPALGTMLEGRLKRLARASRINWPVTDQDLKSYVKQKRRHSPTTLLPMPGSQILRS